MIEQASIVVEAEQQRADQPALGSRSGSRRPRSRRSAAASPSASPARRAGRARRGAWRRRRRARRRPRPSQDKATARSSVQGERSRSARRAPAMEGLERSAALGKRPRRSAGLVASARQSNSISCAGVDAASLRTRLSAGCSRICSASNDSTPPTGMISSPSSDEAVRRQRRDQRLHLRKIAAERPPGLGLERDLVAVAEDEAAEAVPFGLELPALAVGQRLDQLRLHRRQRERTGQAVESGHGASMVRAKQTPGIRRSSATLRRRLVKFLNRPPATMRRMATGPRRVESIRPVRSLR